MKRVYFTIIVVIFTAHIYGQKNDYLTILKSLPPVPDNVLATEEEKEIYRDKISDIRTLLTDYQTQFENIVEREISQADINTLETVLKEYETIFDQHVNNVLANITDGWVKLFEKNQELTSALDKANEPYYEQLRVIISKPKSAENDKLNRSLRKTIYDSKLLLYPNLQREMSDFLKDSFDELTGVAQYVNKLDSMSLNVIKLPSAGVGPALIENYVRLLYDFNGAYFYRLGSFDEYFNDGWSVDHLLIGQPI